MLNIHKVETKIVEIRVQVEALLSEISHTAVEENNAPIALMLKSVVLELRGAEAIIPHGSVLDLLEEKTSKRELVEPGLVVPDWLS